MTAEMLVTLFEIVFIVVVGLAGSIFFNWQSSIVCIICSPIIICGMYLLATMKINHGGKKVDNTATINNYNKSNALLSDVVINYRTVISLGQKNVDSICLKFE